MVFRGSFGRKKRFLEVLFNGNTTYSHNAKTVSLFFHVSCYTCSHFFFSHIKVNNHNSVKNVSKTLKYCTFLHKDKTLWLWTQMSRHYHCNCSDIKRFIVKTRFEQYYKWGFFHSHSEFFLEFFRGKLRKKLIRYCNIFINFSNVFNFVLKFPFSTEGILETWNLFEIWNLSKFQYYFQRNICRDFVISIQFPNKNTCSFEEYSLYYAGFSRNFL